MYTVGYYTDLARELFCIGHMFPRQMFSRQKCSKVKKTKPLSERTSNFPRQPRTRTTCDFTPGFPLANSSRVVYKTRFCLERNHKLHWEPRYLASKVGLSFKFTFTFSFDFIQRWLLLIIACMLKL